MMSEMERLNKALIDGGLVCTVSLGQSRYVTPRPLARIVVPRAAHRDVGAALHLFAALAEAATAEREGWCVCTERSADAIGYVFLDLGAGTDAEAARGLAHLREIATRLRWI